MPRIGMQRLGQRSLKLSKGQLREKLIPRQRLVAIRIAKAKCTKVSSHLSLDVEFSHYWVQGYQRVHPAEVCIVDWDGETVYHSYCRTNLYSKADYGSGVPPSLTEDAKMLQIVSSEIQRLIRGKILIGHGIKGDLRSLSIQHPSELLLDTVNLCPIGAVCRLTLKRLAKAYLGIRIQRGSGRHSAREDAQAAMLLYRHWFENGLL